MGILFENETQQKRLVLQTDLCGGCGYCIEVCPQDCLEFSDKVNQRIVYPVKAKDRSCTDCYLCLEERPKESKFVKCPWEACTMCNSCTNICPDFAIYTVPMKKEKNYLRDESKL